MIRLIAVIAGLLATLGAAGSAHAIDLPDPGTLVAARLLAAAPSVSPGKVLWTDISLKIKPGWHVYWRNPGDAGLPVAAAWHLPEGFSAGAIEWPVPERFQTGALVNYGYRGIADLLVPIAVPRALPPGHHVPIAADVTWLACSEICIPGSAKLSLDLPAVGTAAPDPATAAHFAAARARLPAPAPFAARFADEAHDYRLIVPAAAFAGLADPSAAFFPYDGNAIDASAAPAIVRGTDGLALILAKAGGPGAHQATTLNGVLVLQSAGKTRAYTISALPGAAVPEPNRTVGWWGAVVLAFLGGLVLNLMPCVFPILSLKVLSLADFARREDGLFHGLAYGAGAVLSFVVLGGLLLTLRAGGTAIGWGFQLQSPIVVGLLAYLLLTMGLSLSGVAEFGAGLAGAGSRLGERGGLAGAFGTGVLATVVAAPCTAPFMGAALGFALVAPAPAALAVFAALGMGLAAPFVLAAAVPGTARLLPRPGAWMAVVKQVLAFPLYGTVAWLVWVLMQEVAPGDALMVLFGLVAVAFAVWVYGRTRAGVPAARRWGTGLAALGLAAAIGLAATIAPAPAGGRTAATARDRLPYQQFSLARLAALRAEQTPVFVNLTASWCVTCLFNEHAALDHAAVRRRFAAHGIVALKGDWTRRNPEITAFLRKYGRSGVPLYLLYDRRGDATVLPQILTESTVLDAVAKL